MYPNQPYLTNDFTVEIDGIESPDITKVSGLSQGDVDSIEVFSGGRAYAEKVSSGIIKYGDLTFERHMDGTKADGDLQKWFNDMFGNNDGSFIGSHRRRNGSVVKKGFNQDGARITVFRYIFENAWIKSFKFSDLDASSSSLMKQTIVLAVNRMYIANS